MAKHKFRECVSIKLNLQIQNNILYILQESTHKSYYKEM